MAYEYDVFFSYKRDVESNSWHEKLKTKLASYLRLELGVAIVEVFFDVEEIGTGELWKQKIASSLRRSKCIVCIWSNLYFSSDHCNSEWKSFEQRCSDLGVTLIFPARIVEKDDCFPGEARNRQSRDLHDYFSLFDVFWQSQRVLELEAHIRTLAREIARAVRTAPAHSENFPIVEFYGVAAAPPSRPKIERIANG